MRDKNWNILQKKVGQKVTGVEAKGTRAQIEEQKKTLVARKKGFCKVGRKRGGIHPARPSMTAKTKKIGTSDEMGSSKRGKGD